MYRHPGGPCGPIHAHVSASENIKLQIMMAQLEESLKNEFISKEQLKTINSEFLVGEGNIEISCISRIDKTASEGLVDTYTIYFNDGSETYFTVTNGAKGETGAQGEQGPRGESGTDGLGIAKLEITVEGHLIITYTDETEVDLGKIVGADGLTGETGKSAYELAQENGYQGTLQEWLESLRGAQGPEGPQGAQGPEGPAGQDGQSAYQLAVSLGFEGDEAAWLTSLKGADGANGTDGKDGQNGADGQSAYQLAVALGFEGNETAWLESLKGEAGADGRDGVDGTNGSDGQSAYALAVKLGFDGDEEAWLTSLKGATGEPGPKGDIGPQGPIGPQGETGAALTFDMLTPEQKAELKGEKGDPGETGAPGTQGPQGIQGEAGTPGKDGTDGITPHIENGNWFIGDLDTGVTATGPQGETGPEGPKGDKGDKGDAFTYNDFTSEQLEALRGSQGIQGEVGPEGPIGPKGNDGLTTSIKIGETAYEHVDGVITLPEFASEQFVTDKIAAINIPDVSGFLTEIPEEYVTNTELETKGYLTEHQSLEGYAKSTDVTAEITAAVATKAEEIPFTTAKFVTNAFGGFVVGDDLNGLTIAEIFAKLLGLSDTNPGENPEDPEEPSGIVDTIIKEELPMYAVTSTGELQPLEYQLLTFDENTAKEKNTTNGFYQIVDANGEVIESGYQQQSEVYLDMPYMIALPKEIDFDTHVTVQSWNDLESYWETKNIKLISDPQVFAEMFGQTPYEVFTQVDPEIYTIWFNPDDGSTGALYRFIITE